MICLFLPLQAVMMEVQRHANILPAGVHHVASIDLQVGYNPPRHHKLMLHDVIITS